MTKHVNTVFCCKNNCDYQLLCLLSF